MNGPHDLGGADGFGPVIPDRTAPLFYDGWERRAFALTLAMGFTGMWTLDATRHARERIPPADYLSFSYNRIWFEGLLIQLKDHGLATDAEISSGKSDTAPPELRYFLSGDIVETRLAQGGPADRKTESSPGFSIGDNVRARLMNTSGHTRLPGYIRGATGTIERVHGCHVYPDTSAHGQGANPQWLYGIAFNAEQLWGESRRGDSVHLDLWEPYLERI